MAAGKGGVMRGWWRRFAVLFGLALTMSGCMFEYFETGPKDFVQYCSGCHGFDARGGDPVDGVAVPDLTRLAAFDEDPSRAYLSSVLFGPDRPVAHAHLPQLDGRFVNPVDIGYAEQKGLSDVPSMPANLVLDGLDDFLRRMQAR